MTSDGDSRSYALVTFLINATGVIAQNARRALVERKCPLVLVAVLPTPTLLGKTDKLSVMLAPMHACDTKEVLKMLFSLPEGAGVAVYR
jgi:hypothetical protein